MFSGVHVAVSMGGSMSSALLMKDYLPYVWRQRPGQLFNQISLLLWDAHASHKDAEVLATLRTRHQTSVILIPPGMTPLLQPLDVAVNKVYRYYSPLYFANIICSVIDWFYSNKL